MSEPLDDTLKTAVEAFAQKVRRAREEVCREELRRCCVELGITQATLCQWMQHPGFPPPDAFDCLDIDAIRRWLATDPMKFDPLTTDRLMVAHLRERDLVRLLQGELQLSTDAQLPAGTVVRRIWPSPERRSISLLLAHESFDPVLEGCEPKAMILEFAPSAPLADTPIEPAAPEEAPKPFHFGEFLGPA